jgi:2-polyprenyl-3-methyl-5-hydroxy-6-metoxy-1,4-benzoquinol methylase
MTANKRFKRLVRARAAKTGESYAAALRHFAPTSERGQIMTTTILDPATFDDIAWDHITHLTIVPFLQDDGRLVLIRHGSSLVVPGGPVLDGEDPFIDTALRVPLEVAGFRRQHTQALAARGDHAAIWCEGYRYDGDRAHADTDWWIGDAAAGVAELRTQGAEAAARLVELADRARRSLTDDEFFIGNTRLLETAYLDPRHTNPRQGSGFGGSEDEWFARRHHVSDAVDRDGTFIDVGCANGLLLENLVAWCAEHGHRIDPYGVDLSERLVEEAARRLPAWTDHLFVGNALDWAPPDDRRFDFVHSLLELVPPPRRAELVVHLRDHVAAPRGRVILSHYVPIDREDQWPRAVLESFGFTVAGETEPDRTDARPVPPSAWIEAPN